MQNTIVFCGNTGVGKSYICNRIFKMYGSSVEFKHSASIRSETVGIQQGKIVKDGRVYTILDTPGFFDTESKNNSGRTNLANLCKLVAALESCEQIFAIVFVFTDRFSEPHMVWFERLVSLVTKDWVGNIILLHNKLPPWDLEQRAENFAEINSMIRRKIQVAGELEYIWFSWDGDNKQLECLMTAVPKLVPFKVIKLIVPEICFEKTEISEPFREVITELKKEIQRRTVATFVNVYKVRFDGTRDLVEKRQIGEPVQEVYQPLDCEKEVCEKDVCESPKQPIRTEKVHEVDFQRPKNDYSSVYVFAKVVCAVAAFVISLI